MVRAPRLGYSSLVYPVFVFVLFCFADALSPFLAKKQFPTPETTDRRGYIKSLKSLRTEKI